MVDISRPNVPVTFPDEAEHRRQIALALNQALLGRLNNTGLVTLAANQATTVVNDLKVAVQSKVFLTPLTASAAAEVATGNLFIVTVTEKKFTIAHTNNAVTDRDFAYAILG